MSPARALIIGAALGAAFPVPGCGRESEIAPPELRLGRDECAECGMLVAEDRCSSALLVERDGRRRHLVYDDIGCMIDHERAGGIEGSILGRWVHDYGTRAWVEAGAATFLMADPESLKTPMASGLVASVSRADAERIRNEHPGDLVDWKELVERTAPTAERRDDPAGGG